jgi:hypothetical protein
MAEMYFFQCIIQSLSAVALVYSTKKCRILNGKMFDESDLRFSKPFPKLDARILKIIDVLRKN